MSASISPENEQFLNQAIANGQFADRGAALDEAVRLLRRREELKKAVNAGVEQLNSGRYVEYDDTEIERFCADIQSRVRRSTNSD